VGEVLLLDTHALLWWALDPGRLSRPAAIALAEVDRRGALASAISIWELAIKVKRGGLELPLSIDEFTRRLERSGVIELVPVDAAIWLRSVALPWEHRDPADRVIVATALHRGATLVTADAEIQRFAGVAWIW
jgi:PIN domain nuclease of toxin-antitoxin system